MRPSNRSTDRSADGSRVAEPSVTDPSVDHPERGSAALEFIIVGLILLVPLVYLIVSLGLIQSQSLGVESGARHIARAVSTSSDAGSARHIAARVLDTVVDEYGIDPDSVQLEMACVPAGVTCPQAGATLIVTVQTRVALPLVPPILGLEHLASVPVEASAAQRVSRFWGAQ